MRLFRHFLYTLFFLLLSPQLLSAGVGRWTASGPEGGDVLSFALVPGDPGRVLVGTRGGGVFETRDGGSHWKYLGLADRAVTALAASPDGRGALYAGTDTGFFRSRDGGITWEPRNSGLLALPIEAVVVDPAQPSRLYAALHRYQYPGAIGGLFRSTDGGGTWAPTGLNGPGVPSVIVDPRNSNVLFALVSGRYYITVRRSIDAGATWEEIYVSPGSEMALTFDPHDSNTLYAGEWDPTGGTGISYVYKSSDAGTTWAPAGGALGPGDFQAILVSPIDRSAVYAATNTGLFVSRDSGATWSRVGDRKTVALALDPATGFVFAGGADGVSASRDEGLTWTPSNPGLVATEILLLASDSSASELHARTRGGIFRSSDRGERWQEERLLPPGTFGFAVHPANASRRFAGIVELGFCRGVVRSVDAGETWTPTSLTTSCIARFAFDPQSPAVVYAIGQSGLWRSDDDGINWTMLALSVSVISFAIDPVTPAILYAGTSRAGVFRSEDRGGSWRPVNRGIPNATWSCSSDGSVCSKRDITSLALDPRTPSTVYAGVLDPPMYNGSAFVGAASGVWKSFDGGETWAEVGRGISGTSSVAIAVDPTDPRKIYAGTDQGVFRSLDVGATFSPFNPGLTHHVISSIQIEASGKALHAGTLGGGVFDIELLENRPDLIRVPTPREAPRVIRRPTPSPD